MPDACNNCIYCQVAKNPYYCNLHKKDIRDDDSCNKFVPTPGSLAAQEKGCTCAIMDNHYGKGRPHKTHGRVFWISEDCPLHGGKKK